MSDDNATYVPMESRPEGVPEKFWHPEKGLNVSGMASAYTTLESGRETFKRETEDRLRQELQPKSPERYTIPEVKLDGMPEGFAFKLDEDPMVGLIEKAATDGKLTQDQFAAVVQTYASDKAAKLRATGEDTRRILGDNATERVNRVIGRLKDRISDPEQYAALSAAVSDPKAVIALEKLVGEAAPRPGTGGGTGEPELTEAKLRAMQQDERYWNPAKRDPDYIRQIEEGWAKVAPGKIGPGTADTG